LAQQAHLSGAIIVTTPQQVALGVAQKGLQMFRQVNIPVVGVIENMSGFTCPECGTHTAIFKTGGGEEMAKKFSVNFLGGIPIDPELMASGDEGKPLLSKDVASPAKKSFYDIAERFKTVMRTGDFGINEPKKIELSKEGNLVVHWPDGKVEEFAPYDLRKAAPDAAANVDNIPLDVKINSFEKVGRYAVSLVFSDGHDTGIYRFDNLQELNQKKSDASKQSFNV
jgi:ATP-binding protein involved in chromosome partitioning